MMLSIFRKTALVSAALSLALIGATAPASAGFRNSGGGGGFGGGGSFHGGFSGGGNFHSGFNGGSFNGGAFRSAPTFNGGGLNHSVVRSGPMFNNGGFGNMNGLNSPAVSNFRPNGNPGNFAGGDWHRHHHHHFFGGFVPFAYYGGYPYYDNSYDNDYSYDDCTEYRPVYDRYGHYLGRRPVNVC
jgi:hypothetical protein